MEGDSRLEAQAADQLEDIEVSPVDLHRPDLDEDLSIDGIPAGDSCQRYGPAPESSDPILDWAAVRDELLSDT